MGSGELARVRSGVHGRQDGSTACAPGQIQLPSTAFTHTHKQPHPGAPVVDDGEQAKGEADAEGHGHGVARVRGHALEDLSRLNICGHVRTYGERVGGECMWQATRLFGP